MQCLDSGFELPSWETHVYTCLAQFFSDFARIISLCNCLVQCSLCNFHGHNFFHLLAFYYYYCYCILTSFWAKHFLSKEKPNSIILQLATIDKIIFITNRKIVFCVTFFMQLYTCHDAPPYSWMDSTASPKAKITKGEGVGVCFLTHSILGVGGRAGALG